MSEAVEAAAATDRSHDPEAGPTYYGRPAIKEPVWIWSVPAYLFTGGAAAGAATLAGVAQAARPEDLRWLVQRGRWVSLAGAVLSTGFLIHDLGRPARFLNMLRVFRPTSAMSLGSWTLASFGGAASVAALAPAVLPGRWGGRLGAVGGVGAALLAPVLGTYTGVLLADTAVPVWAASRRELPRLFAASAMAGAADVLDLLGPDAASARVTRRVGMAAKGVEMVAATTVEKAVGEHPEVGRALSEGVAGDMWKGAKACTAASLATSALPVPSRLHAVRRMATAVLGVLGGILMRFAVLRAGTASARDPQATFAPQRRARDRRDA